MGGALWPVHVTVETCLGSEGIGDADLLAVRAIPSPIPQTCGTSQRCSGPGSPSADRTLFVYTSERSLQWVAWVRSSVCITSRFP